MMERLLPCEEPEASLLLEQELKRIGVAVYTGMRMESIQDTGFGVDLNIRPASPSHCSADGIDPGAMPPDMRMAAAPLKLSADFALISTGRRPSLRVSELDALGIRYDSRGIGVDDNQRTNIPGIYAIGDATGGVMLAHRAMHQGKILGNRLSSEAQIGCGKAVVPAVVYAHPQISRVGMTEEEARAANRDVHVQRRDYAQNITARIQLLGQGFVKLVFRGERLAGATIVGDQAGELIASLSLAIAAGIGRRELSDWIIPHPTLSELLGTEHWFGKIE
jgi:dihydrolipoamide dehydrogenase